MIRSFVQSFVRPFVQPFTGGAASGPDDDIIALFAHAESGMAFHVTPDHVFSDTAATVPAVVNGPVAALKTLAGSVTTVTQATSANQPMLRGTPTGENLIGQDGDCFTPANWTLGAGWTIVDGALTAADASSAVTLGFAAVPGKTYKVSYVIAYTSGSVAAGFGGTAGRSRSLLGLAEEWITASNAGNLTLTGDGFTGSITQIRVYDADSSAVGAPYFLSLTGTQWLASALTGFADYPLTQAAVFSGGGGGGLSAWASNASFDALLDAGALDHEGAEELNSYVPVHPDYMTTRIIAGFSSAALTTESFLIAGPTTTVAHAFGAKNTLMLGRARTDAYYCDGKIYSGFVVNRSLTSGELESVRVWQDAAQAVQCWGDSLTAGTGTDPAHAYPARLSHDTGWACDPHGYGGQTSATILGYFQADTSRRKEWVQIIWVGTNDSIAQDGLDPTKANIATFVAGVQGAGRYLVLGLFRFDGGTTTPQNLTDMYAYLQATYGNRFVDVRAYLQGYNDGSANDLADIANGLVPRSLRSDNIHLNNVGYQLVSNCLFGRMKTLGWL